MDREYINLRINNYIKKAKDFPKDKIREIKFNGYKFLVYPQVFNPVFSVSAEKLNEIIRKTDFTNMKVLDMGCGTGVQGIFALFNNAEFATFVDFSQTAVENTKANVKMHNLGEKSEVIKSNLFATINSNNKFDVILFNSPFIYSDKKLNNELLLTVYDYKYRTLGEFFKQARKFIKPSGRILFVFSNLGDKDLLDRIMSKYNYQSQIIKSWRIKNNEKWWVFQIRPI